MRQGVGRGATGRAVPTVWIQTPMTPPKMLAKDLHSDHRAIHLCRCRLDGELSSPRYSSRVSIFDGALTMQGTMITSSAPKEAIGSQTTCLSAHLILISPNWDPTRSPRHLLPLLHFRPHVPAPHLSLWSPHPPPRSLLHLPPLQPRHLRHAALDPQ